MKILYICPHLSTGGMPAYTLRLIQEAIKTTEVSVLEVNNYSDDYVVQRNKIKEIVPLTQLFGNQDSLQETIFAISPDIVHCQELPESFLKDKNLEKLYNKRRKYNIIVTTHSSLTKGKDFKFLPDRIIAVNQWQADLFKNELPNVEVDTWEYPIESKYQTDKQKIDAALKLGLKINVKHILNIGLFTPGKNQGELFEIAKQNPQNNYHFVGNLAENFKDYWEPLMKNKPDNCIIWGERDDVELFYQACDEMWFTSKFELNPLCVREALSYGLPVKMRKLETYGTQYDDNELVTYTDFK